MPKATAKMRVQKPEMRNQISLPLKKPDAFQESDIGGEPDSQRR